MSGATETDPYKVIEGLRTRILELEAQVRFLGNHPTLARGMAGENLALQSTLGSMTPHTSSIDIELRDGRSVEVKTSYPKPQPGRISRRWAWEKIFGQKNNKRYDLLLLVGETDHEYHQSCLDPASPFIFFLIPFDDVMPLTTNGVNGARKIQLNTNPKAARLTASRPLFDRFQVTSHDLSAITNKQ